MLSFSYIHNKTFILQPQTAHENTTQYTGISSVFVSPYPLDSKYWPQRKDSYPYFIIFFIAKNFLRIIILPLNSFTISHTRNKI